MQYKNEYNGWTLETKFDSNYGQLTFNNRDGVNHLVFSAFSQNNLWYHYLDGITEVEYNRIGAQTKAVINALNANAQYQL